MGQTDRKHSINVVSSTDGWYCIIDHSEVQGPFDSASEAEYAMELVVRRDENHRGAMLFMADESHVKPGYH